MSTLWLITMLLSKRIESLRPVPKSPIMPILAFDFIGAISKSSMLL